MLKLTRFQHDRPREEIWLDANQVGTVGSSHDSAWVVSDAGLSPVHFQLKTTNDAAFIDNLQPHSKLLINGEPSKSSQLKNGDDVRIDDVRFAVWMEEVDQPKEQSVPETQEVPHAVELVGQGVSKFYGDLDNFEQVFQQICRQHHAAIVTNFKMADMTSPVPAVNFLDRPELPNDIVDQNSLEIIVASDFTSSSHSESILAQHALFREVSNHACIRIYDKPVKAAEVHDQIQYCFGWYLNPDRLPFFIEAKETGIGLKLLGESVGLILVQGAQWLLYANPIAETSWEDLIVPPTAP